jgi:hypothetical protein
MSMREPMPPSQEARARHMASLEDAVDGSGRPSPWAGWVTFASLMLVMLGCLNGFQGFLAMFDDGYFVARSDELALVNYDAWGAVLVVWGIVLLLLGAGLNARRGWARWGAIVVAMLDVILQVGFFPSSPLLALMLIALDVVIIFALTARWEEGRDGGL